MKKAHYLNCDAPICQGYPTKDLIWYPDEKICKKTPYTKMLTNRIKVYEGTKGRNPNAYTTASYTLI